MVHFVVVESPFAGKTAEEFKRHQEYLNALMADCFRRGEVPFASHAIYTRPGVLDDNKPEERKLGIESGFELAQALHLVATTFPGLFTFKRIFGMDRGESGGMKLGRDDAAKRGQPTEDRTLGAEWSKEKDPPTLPAGWGFPGASRKAHFFTDGEMKSVCGKLLYTGPREPDNGKPSKDDCAVCRAKLAGYMGGIQGKT